MHPALEFVIYKLLPPAIVAAVALLFVRVIFRHENKRRRQLTPLAVAIAFLVGWLCTLGWPGIVSRTAAFFLFHSAIAWAILAYIPLRMSHRIILFGIGAWVMTLALLHPLFETDFNKHRLLSALSLVGIDLLATLWFICCASLARRFEPSLTAIIWLMTLICSAVLVTLSGSLKYGIQGSTLAAAWGGATVVILLLGRIELGVSISMFLCGTLLGLLINNTYWPAPGLAFHHMLLVMAAPLMPWLIPLPGFTHRNNFGWNLARIIVVAIPLALAITQSYKQFKIDESKQNSEYNYDY